MSGTCKMVGGLVVLLSGLFATGWLGAAVAGMSSGTLAGALLALYGLVMLVHGAKLCPMCANCNKC